MITRNQACWLMVTAGIACGAVVFGFFLQASGRRSALLAEACAKRLRLRADVRSAEEANARVEQQYAELSVAVRAQEAKAAVPRKPSPIGPSLSELFEKDPALSRLWDNRQKALMTSLYGAVFKALKLSSEEQAAFFEIWREYEARLGDVWATARAQQLDRTDPAITALLKEEEKKWHGAMLARFGEKQFEQMREFGRKERPRQLVDGLATSVAFTTPLTAAQADRLTQIIADATPAYRAGGEANNEAIDWADVDRNAQAVLLPAQYASWTQDDPRDPKGFPSRSEIELEEVYKRAVEAEKRKAEEFERPTS